MKKNLNENFIKYGVLNLKNKLNLVLNINFYRFRNIYDRKVKILNIFDKFRMNIDILYRRIKLCFFFFCFKILGNVKIRVIEEIIMWGN